MPARTHDRSHRIAIGLALAMLFLPVAAQRATASSNAIVCGKRLQAARNSSLAETLRCHARARRQGGAVSARCLARARTRLERFAARCAADPTDLTRALDRCTAAVLGMIPNGGACPARKLTAVRASLRGEPRDLVCRAFARAGSCAGDCLAIGDALTGCWSGARQEPPSRTLPAAEPDDQIVLFGAYEADAISTATVAGQDEETETARVVIAPGTAPLYVVLASYEHVVWRFEGAVSRVAHVVLTGYGASGVTGVSADRVADLAGSGDGGGLGYFYDVDDAEGRQVRAALESALGRRVDVFAGQYTVGTLTLPDASVEPSDEPTSVPPGFDPYVYQTGLWFNRGGVVAVDPWAIVSSMPAESYEVLPQGFGLAQLVATGAIEAREGYFYIARAIPRFPAGLYGAESVSFVLGRGVPMPAGSPGHSCVISEETGLPLSMGFLCGIEPPEPVSCSLPAAPAADQVVLFGVYEGDAMSTVSTDGPDEVTQTARVVIEPGAAPLYIVLAAYEHVIWRFEGDVTRVDRVVLTGYGAQGVTGVAGDRVTFLSAEHCVGYFYDVQSPEGVAARAAIERALGRQVDVLAGSYGVGTLALPSATVSPSPTPTQVPPGFDPRVYEQAGLWFNPGGLVQIDPSQVVSSKPAEAYDVLPEGFGLARLVATGALEVVGDEFFTFTYRIARAIPRFPAGLYGAHLARFVLGRGVPMPAGSPGHSCVISEETGEPIGLDFVCDIFGD